MFFHNYQRAKPEQKNTFVIRVCIFLLTMQHQYLNILYVSIQRYNSLGFKSEIGLQSN